MKKVVIGIVSVLVVVAIAVVAMRCFSTKPNSENVIDNSSRSNTENQETKPNETKPNEDEPKEIENDEGYEIIVSKKDISIEKGEETSFEITFTNPDESSIREYIKCEDQDDIILVKYSPLDDKKITVEVEGLKAGTTEISVCDYNYPDVKEIVKVNVTESNNTLEGEITEEKAYEGVNNYCHDKYDWSAAEENPEIMKVSIGEATDTEYKIVFRSYTGAYINFYVNKTSGVTRIVELNPVLNTEEETGTININDYLKEN